MLIDTHCHVHDSEFYPDNKEHAYLQARDAGVVMICVGTDVRSSIEAVEFARTHEGCYAIVGIHPHEAKDSDVAEIRELLQHEQRRTQNRDPRTIIGIGEIGLDYFYDHSPQDIQQQVLRQQLQLAVEFALPVSFHIREAFVDFWPILDEFPDIKGVMHSFT
ncbi:MAG: TatD family hydrolase, partial [Candidatus Saccharibacteria bacterium]|nr:TatD family hydrolase [Candidatus Saccharibacteria bacterium]